MIHQLHLVPQLVKDQREEEENIRLGCMIKCTISG